MTDGGPPTDDRDTGVDLDVFVADEQNDLVVDLQRYARLARMVMRQEKVRDDAVLSMVFADEATIADLHERFLGLEGPTDVLAFPMDEELVESGRQPDQGGRGPGSPAEPSDPPVLVGDLVICPKVAQSQATEHGCTVEEELELLVVHGVLHLLEYDHADDDEAATMRRRELELLDEFRAAEAGRAGD